MKKNLKVFCSNCEHFPPRFAKVRRILGDFFGDGKGAGFLSDIRLIRKQFRVTLEKPRDKESHVLKLMPVKKTFDLTEIFLSISKETFDVVHIVTHNTYGDETRIDLTNFQFLEHPDDALFHFNIPEGADVLELDK